MKTDLDEKIRAFEKKRHPEEAQIDSSLSGASNARLGYEFFIATLFFSGIGYLLDKQFNTIPLFTLILLFVGFITGVYNAWRTMNGFNEEIGLKNPNKKGSDGQD